MVVSWQCDKMVAEVKNWVGLYQEHLGGGKKQQQTLHGDISHT